MQVHAYHKDMQVRSPGYTILATDINNSLLGWRPTQDLETPRLTLTLEQCHLRLASAV